MSSPARSRSRRRHRLSPLSVAGLVLVIAGVCCLGWVAYEFFGTNVVSERAHDHEKAQLRRQWQQAEPSAGRPSTSATTTTPRRWEPGQGQPSLNAPEIVVPGEAIALLRIPAFGADYEVPILAGTDLDTLSRGVGHYPSTAQPGQIGNFALAGHRITHGEPFRKLLELDPGDEVIVETRDSIFTYVIDEAPKSLTVKPSASWVLDPVPGEEGARPTQALITLTTCQDLFRSPDRSIGFGYLASTKNKG